MTEVADIRKPAVTVNGLFRETLQFLWKRRRILLAAFLLLFVVNYILDETITRTLTFFLDPLVNHPKFSFLVFYISIELKFFILTPFIIGIQRLALHCDDPNDHGMKSLFSTYHRFLSIGIASLLTRGLLALLFYVYLLPVMITINIGFNLNTTFWGIFFYLFYGLLFWVFAFFVILEILALMFSGLVIVEQHQNALKGLWLARQQTNRYAIHLFSVLLLFGVIIFPLYFATTHLIADIFIDDRTLLTAILYRSAEVFWMVLVSVLYGLSYRKIVKPEDAKID
jgi:hypothetical protein